MSLFFNLFHFEEMNVEEEKKITFQNALMQIK